MATMTNVTRRTALIGLSTLFARPARGEGAGVNRADAGPVELAELESPARFEIIPVSGSLKETRQSGQELIWRLMTRQSQRVLRISSLSVGLLTVRQQVTTTFSCNISSFDYSTSQEAHLHIIFRSRGGAALHTSLVSIGVECTDKERTMHPATDQIPESVASLVFANAASVEITDHTETNERGFKVRRCG
jgi:hypothetical protein